MFSVGVSADACMAPAINKAETANIPIVFPGMLGCLPAPVYAVDHTRSAQAEKAGYRNVLILLQ
jgi:hypothetical protein